MYKLFMEFENPTERALEKKQGVQGFAVYQDTGFGLFHTGLCAAYNLLSRDKTSLDPLTMGFPTNAMPIMPMMLCSV